MNEFGNEEKEISHIRRKQMVRRRRSMDKHNASRLNREDRGSPDSYRDHGAPQELKMSLPAGRQVIKN